jgi:hypothetical protein
MLNAFFGEKGPFCPINNNNNTNNDPSTTGVNVDENNL